MEKDLEQILKKIISKTTKRDLFTLKHIHKNSFGYVIECYDIDEGRNFTCQLNDILFLIEKGNK